MKQRGRHVRPPLDDGYVPFNPPRTLPPRKVAVGVVQHGLTGHYHAWLSLDGTELLTIGVYAAEEQAHALIAQIIPIIHHFDHTPEAHERLRSVMALGIFDSVVPPAEMALPEDQVRDILRIVAIAAPHAPTLN